MTKRHGKDATLAFFTIYIVWSAKTCVVAQSDNLLVTLPHLGKVHGSITYTAWTNHEIYQFLSVPYAKAPSGNLRFKAPMPKKEWSGIIDGSKYGRRCPVSSHLSQADNDSIDLEDCLTLCVYTRNVSKAFLYRRFHET